MSGAPKVPWPVLEDEYVVGSDEVTQTNLAEKYHTQRATVTRHATKGDWNTKRAQYRHQVAMKTRERTSVHKAKIRADQIKSGMALRSEAAEALLRLRKPRTRIVVGRDGKETTDVLPPLIEEQLDAVLVMRYMRAAAQIENAALGVQAEVKIGLIAELEDFVHLWYARLCPTCRKMTLDAIPSPNDTGEASS
jgi:hypothetical protein